MVRPPRVLSIPDFDWPRWHLIVYCLASLIVAWAFVAGCYALVAP